MPARDRHQRGRRCRAAVRSVVGVLLFTQLIVAIAIDQSRPAVRDPEYAILEDMLRERIAERPGSPTVLFVGSSRVAHGFDAARATGTNNAVVFNFGVPGAGPFFQKIIFERLAAAGIQPNVVFLEVLHTFFNAAGPRSLDHGLLDGARLSSGEVAEVLNYGNRSQTGPIRRWAFARALPLCRHQAELRDSLDYRLNPNYGEAPAAFRPCDELGYRPRACPANEWAALTTIAHENYDPFYTAFRIDSYAWARLVETIRSLQLQGIHVVCVLMPEGSEFRGRFEGNANGTPDELVRRLTSDAGVSVVDARDWLEDSAFFDQHHLLPAGATAFADRFRIEVLEPALAQVDRRIAEHR